MVGLVLVSHSVDLARGLRDLVAQMEPEVAVGIAGGTENGELGTSLELVMAALDEADDGNGAVILFDLGSAEMTAESALEFLEDDRRDCFVVVDAPLVEGALAAASTAGGGGALGEVANAARRLAATSDENEPPSETELAHAVELSLRNTQGLHARPAGQVVRALRPLDADVRIERTDTGQSANARSLLDLISLGAAAGTTIVVRAGGPEADAALARVRELVDNLFGEPPAGDETEAARDAS